MYYGTDTRAVGLLTGAALAFTWPPRKGIAATSGVWTTDVVGATALGMFVLCFARLNPFQPFLYRGGFVLIGLLTAVLIVVGVHPQSGWVRRTLACRALRWVGARSVLLKTALTLAVSSRGLNGLVT